MKWIYFPGAGHNGHTLIASILDSHPNIAIANDYDELTFDRVIEQAKKENNWTMGAKYKFPLKGQREWEDLQVVGTTGVHPFKNTKNTKGFPIYVIRNPFDVISSRARKNISRYKGPEDPMDVTINKWVSDCEPFSARIQNVMIFFEDFVNNPQKDIDYLTKRLRVDRFDADRMEAALGLVKPLMRSYDPTIWTDDQISRVQEFCDRNELFSHYKPGEL